MIPPAAKHIVYSPWILHNNQIPCYRKPSETHPCGRGKKVQASAIYKGACSDYCDKLYSCVLVCEQQADKVRISNKGRQ